MTNIKSKRFCYLEPSYPEEGYVAVAYLLKNDAVFLYALEPVYNDVNILRTEVNLLKKEAAKNDITLLSVSVVKIKLKRKYGLRKEHWTESKAMENSGGYRLLQFVELMKGIPEFYNIMILPRYYNKVTKLWSFVNWLPILISADDEKIDRLILTSDEPVDRKAKSMGIYGVEEIKEMDISTGELSEVKETKSTKGSEDYIN